MMPALILAGSALHLVASLVYVRNTLLGRSRPNRVTFFLWGIIPFIAVVAGYSAGGEWALVPVFMSGAGPFLVFLASFFNKDAYWKLGVLDYVCGALSILAVVAWISTDEPALAVVFAIFADACAGYPTLVKAWKHPETETGFPFAIAFVTEIVGLFALATVDFSEYGFLAYLVLLNGALILAVYRADPLRKLRQEFAR
jgi:hypothetical protein